MKKLLSLLLDLLFLAASISNGGSLGDNLRVIGLVVASVALALAIALMVLLSILLIDQRRPPYPM